VRLKASKASLICRTEKKD